VKFPYNSFEFNRKLEENHNIFKKTLEKPNKIADNPDKIHEKSDEFSEFLSQLFPLHTNISGFSKGNSSMFFIRKMNFIVLMHS